MALFELGSDFFSSVISSILLSFPFFLFPLSFLFEHDSLLSLSRTGVFGGFIRILIMLLLVKLDFPGFPRLGEMSWSPLSLLPPLHTYFVLTTLSVKTASKPPASKIYGN